MTIRPIVRYPDPRLALPAQPVTAYDGAALAQLLVRHGLGVKRQMLSAAAANNLNHSVFAVVLT